MKVFFAFCVLYCMLLTCSGNERNQAKNSDPSKRVPPGALASYHGSGPTTVQKVVREEKLQTAEFERVLRDAIQKRNQRNNVEKKAAHDEHRKNEVSNEHARAEVDEDFHETVAVRAARHPALAGRVQHDERGERKRGWTTVRSNRSRRSHSNSTRRRYVAGSWTVVGSTGKK